MTRRLAVFTAGFSTCLLAIGALAVWGAGRVRRWMPL